MAKTNELVTLLPIWKLSHQTYIFQSINYKQYTPSFLGFAPK